jgi:hypothetical protein
MNFLRSREIKTNSCNEIIRSAIGEFVDLSSLLSVSSTDLLFAGSMAEPRLVQRQIGLGTFELFGKNSRENSVEQLWPCVVAARREENRKQAQYGHMTRRRQAATAFCGKQHCRKARGRGWFFIHSVSLRAHHRRWRTFRYGALEAHQIEPPLSPSYVGHAVAAICYMDSFL